LVSFLHRNFGKFETSSVKVMDVLKLGLEAIRVRNRLAGFKEELSVPAQTLFARFPHIRRPQLLTMAELICDLTSLKLGREEKRSSRILVKWFHDNWSDAEPLIRNMELFDSEKRKLSFDVSREFIDQKIQDTISEKQKRLTDSTSESELFLFDSDESESEMTNNN
jgi:hypothetical protein